MDDYARAMLIYVVPHAQLYIHIHTYIDAYYMQIFIYHADTYILFARMAVRISYSLRVNVRITE